MGLPRTRLKPMSMRELFALSPGGKFVVYYAKDDNPEYVRFDFEKRKVEQRTDEGFVDDQGDDWDRGPRTVPDLSDNLYDTSRGYAYFFHPGGK